MTRDDKWAVSLEIVVKGYSSFTVERYLRDYEELSTKAIRKLKYRGEVFVNGRKALLKDSVHNGDKIVLNYPPEQVSSYLHPQKMKIDIVYEDIDLLILNKPAGICVHPSKAHAEGTLANGILYYLQERGECAKVHLVNRLDQDTSGILLVAKHTYSAQQLFNQQQEGVLKKEYWGMVEGFFPEEQGKIELPIARVEGQTTKREVSHNGVLATTYYQLIKRFKDKDGEDLTLLALRLGTGRTHQIRVHLNSLGYPLVGDKIYGTPKRELRRQFLHANYLTFLHPRAKEKMEFSLPLPEELEQFRQSLSERA